jgi:hypothetical protein
MIYARVSVLFLMMPVVAYGLVLLLTNTKQTGHNVMIFIICLFLLTGLFRPDKEYRHLSTSINHYYKMSQEAIDLCDFILSESNDSDTVRALVVGRDWNTETVGEASKEFLYIFFDTVLMSSEYTAGINLAWLTIQEKSNIDELFDRYDYFICFEGDTIANLLEEQGLKKIWENETIKLYK